MHPELFHIDIILGFTKITFYTYAACIILGVILASTYAKRMIKKELHISLSNSIIYRLFIVGFVGGKVFFYLENPSFYSNNPNVFFDLFASGFVFYGSFVCIVPVAIWYFKKRSIPILPILDIAAVSTVMIQIIGRIGCFFAGCCYGVQTDSSFGVSFQSTPHLSVHPTQLYEVVLLTIFLVFLLIYKKHKKFKGQLFLFYLSYYGITRFIIEWFRGDTRGQIVEGYLSHSQGIAICLICLSIVTYFKLNKQLT